ncbi:hypothetical protein OAM67_01460 [bacterium]|nr:hypothetical protein [bacterium]
MTSATLPVAAVQLLDPVPEQEQLVAGPAQNMETPVHQPSPQQQPSQPAQPPSKPIPIHTNTYEPLTTAASRDMQTRGLNLPEPVHARDGFIRGMLTRNPLRPGPGMQRL